ncbi:uncharacterized protein FOMMEDRAFT_16715 [Fomitiporia mediterranea MF3/22]|uniref:uncharacterized protein n=1 Tax=Fomitiporia mediterranea (strain MF3/22) TaxID=694068 RepID=UPI0004408C7F|nr:uncharacterized protein FOMMEDRAFT_16715 [Fomitiporia mediterranea MF3/22]EJD08297.1 hypothetical protein FOMMEDRAFT_16715 [Fomitiporia mediterranea MF3/22]
MSKPNAQQSPAGGRMRPIRVIASGTVFLTHVLSLPTFPGEGTISRARNVTRLRGGSVANVLTVLGQFSGVDALLVAPLAGNTEGAMLARDLQREGVNTRFCKVWEGASVPSAWIIEAEDSSSRTIINHNPLPDITHEEFVSLLGPLLVPENYDLPISPLPSPTSPGSPQSSAPFDWLHFEGRSVKTTLSNIIGIDGLARERKWRSQCVFSLDACKTRQGVEALIPHADVIFFSKQYALSQNAAYTTPRPFLLALASSGRVPPHALLIAYWGSAGAALLSVPSREYLQSSGWVDDEPRSTRPLSTLSDATTGAALSDAGAHGVASVRSGSGFWAAGHRAGSGTSSSAFTAFSGSAQSSNIHESFGSSASAGMSDIPVVRAEDVDADADRDSQGTETGGGKREKDKRDESAAQDAFIAGMMYALSQRILPGPPYTPSSGLHPQYGAGILDVERGKWKLEDCLRFASELAGRRARRKDYNGLADEMRRAGWFD